MPVGFSFGECPIRIGTMHLLVAEGAVLEPRVAQIVDGRPDRPQCRVGRGIGHRQVGVALHAYEAHLMPSQHAGFRRPGGWWQAPQPSRRTGACSKGKGPILSLWHLAQPGSLACVVCIWRGKELPWGL